MADKKLNEVTKVTDMAYVPVIMSDGSIGQIAKADLATVVAGLTNAQVPLSVGLGNGVETLIRSPQNMVCIIMAYEVNVHGIGFIGYYLNGVLTKIGGSNAFSASDDGSDICLYVKDRAIYAKMNKGGGGSLKVRIINANSI